MVSIAQIQQWCNAQLLQDAPHNGITELCIDSRRIIYPEESVFIALKTDHRDAHAFIKEVYEKNVRCFIVQQPIDVTLCSDAVVLLVEHTMHALQQIAAAYRKQFNIPILAITGSNGKTVVKEWLFQLLSPELRITRSPKSYNSQIGVPLSVWQLDTDTEMGIFEAGISQPNEMHQLERIISPTQGLITNIGEAHSEGFISQRQKIVEKISLFQHCQLLFFCKDYPELHEAIVHSQQNIHHTRKLLSWSHKQEADLRILLVEKEDGVTLITGLYEGQTLSLQIPFTDPASIENAIHCWLYLLHYGLNNEQINQRMAQLHAVAMRLELKQGLNGSTLINDTYNSDLTSLSIALNFLQQQKQHAQHTLILSDILQIGKPEAVLYDEVAGLLRHAHIHKLIAVGPSLFRYQEMFINIADLQCHFFKTTADLIAYMRLYQPGNEAILLKGARSFHFELISKLLEDKIHQTVLSIDMAALQNNLKVYKSVLNPGVKMMVMVKAFSYGSGSFEIAHALQFAGIDYLAVAYTDEGVSLRRAGITLPIMVMSPEYASYERMIAWRLEPELYNFSSLRAFTRVLKHLQMKHYPVHIKLDTGMHRLGFVENELPELILQLQQTESIIVKSIFSHLAASEDSSMNDFTTVQRHNFESMSELLINGLGFVPLRHLSNSAAISLHPELQYDMVRLGIGLHGIDNSGVLQKKLRNVASLKTTIAQIKEIAAGETIGYGRKGVLQKASRIATINIGYADGYPRNLSKGVGEVLIHGQRAPIIGVVCMDLCMVDVSHIPQAEVEDEVIIFGKDLPISEVAEKAQTIPYEIMTGISQRVKRVYENEL